MTCRALLEPGQLEPRMFEDISFQVALTLAIGAAAGGFVNGLAGFGTSLFALGWWLQVLTPIEAVAMALLVAVTTGFPGLYTVRKAINFRRLSIYLVPAIAGIPIGLSVLHVVSPDVLKIIVATFLILYGIFFFARRNIPTVDWHLPWFDAILGFAGGILGAVAGLSGALPTVWLSLKPWPKMDQRAILQPFNVTVLSLSACALWYSGAYSTLSIAHFAIVIPAALISAIAGLKVFSLITDIHFRYLIVFLTSLSGVILLFQAFY